MNKHINEQSNTNESVREKQGRNNISNRKIVTLATLIAVLSACDFNKEKGATDNVVNLGQEYIKKGNKIYYNHSKFGAATDVSKMDFIEVKNIADPKTFEIVDCFMGKDAKYVYHLAGLGYDSLEIIEGADPQTFRYFGYVKDTSEYEHAGHCFYRDAKSLYRLGNKIEGVDPNTADLTGWTNGIIKDKGNTFKQDGHGYYKDGHEKYIMVNKK